MVSFTDRSLASGEKPFRMNLGRKSREAVRWRSPCAGTVSGWWAGLCNRDGWPAAGTHAAVLGPGALAVAVLARVSVQGRTSRPQGKVDLTSGRALAFLYSANPTNAKVSSLCWDHAGNPGAQRRKPPEKTRRSSTQRPDRMMDAMIVLKGCIHPTWGEGRLPGEGGTWRTSRSQPVCMCVGG